MMSDKKVKGFYCKSCKHSYYIKSFHRNRCSVCHERACINYCHGTKLECYKCNTGNICIRCLRARICCAADWLKMK